MSLPYQYRDFPLMLFMVLVTIITGLVHLTTEGYQTVEITLAGVCSSSDSCPVATSLASLPSTQDVRHQTVDGKGVVSLRAARSLSPKEIWGTIKGMPCRPTRMVVDNREFVSKPIN
jgi:hypothetical protein